MSYFNAKKALKENLQLINSSSDPVMYNLNVALTQLTEAIESDMRDLKRAVEDAEHAARRAGK